MKTKIRVSKQLAVTALITIVVALFAAFTIALVTDASTSKVFSLIGAVTTALGALAGAIGASSLYLTPDDEKKVVQESENSLRPAGSTAIPNPDQKPAVAELQQKAELKDTISVVGWALIIVGAVASLIGLAITPEESPCCDSSSAMSHRDWLKPQHESLPSSVVEP